MERATEREQFLREYEKVLMASNRPDSQQVQEIVIEGKGGEVLLEKTAILEDQARDGNTVVRPVANVIVLPKR